ncbi:unnamed protein product [Parascedosporium putredinis]|uniref:Enolase-phosphatase E1 n=1 Tax=Parascedosporium putredinis TaxID=1442378 RepID=A0A9P1M8A5_9PEZI|nr:unnamed protein product [Parascedosporium putredinis]CAI7988553.1 unnamed protein product [Parascedosporium putredinis]
MLKRNLTGVSEWRLELKEYDHKQTAHRLVFIRTRNLRHNGPVGPLKVVLLDIEGTVCPISFVKDVLFPYALQALSQDLDSIWENPTFAQYRQAFPQEFSSDQEAFKAHVQDLVAMDLKVPYLKALQGYLWEEGYRTGKLRAPSSTMSAPP